MNQTPPCPVGLHEYKCEYWGIDLVCHFDYLPAEKGSVDLMGAPYEPDSDEAMDMVSMFVDGSDVDIMSIIASECIDYLERMALIDLRAFK
jgi:hypothetical protein